VVHALRRSNRFDQARVIILDAGKANFRDPSRLAWRFPRVGRHLVRIRRGITVSAAEPVMLGRAGRPRVNSISNKSRAVSEPAP
jgi:hypothetical protein